MPQGSVQEWAFTLVQATPAQPPWPITGAAWEYVARPAGGGTAVIDITTSENSQGVLAVTGTDSLSQVLMSLYPAATADLAGNYSHALWMNPGTDSAYAWFAGQLIVTAVAQP